MTCLWVLLVPLVLSLSVPAGADAGNPAYLAAVNRARAICQRATPHDSSAGAEAARVLRLGTGETQPEVLRDLLGDPPDLVDAATRLQAIEVELNAPASTSDTARANSKLRAILAETRYQSNGLSPLDRMWAWLGQQFTRLLLALLSGSGGGIVRLAETIVAVGVGLAIAAFLARSLWSRRGGGLTVAAEKPLSRPATDWFAEADRLASTGEYPAALRSLTSAVATAIGGEGAWETSPFTVRELFTRSASIEPLRPLLIPFEASAYGHREPNAEVYARAAGVAAPYRAELPT